MSEMALTADRVIVVGRGRLLRDQTMAEFIASASRDLVRVRSPEAMRLRALLIEGGGTVDPGGADAMLIAGLTSKRIGTVAAGAGITFYELATQTASLEEAYMELTESSVAFRSERRDPSTPSEPSEAYAS